ncbi:FG-GAP repeat protein [Streptomyces sp. NBC_01224]|uniref:FG-GAP repeat protein n=1 Tax=Streptomyces sp. NBC_01224 TaxID=2903783 RepID=UPI002E12240B|nr:FG-GAP repeat protein [Streptomyces sp. NBC_01224]
MTDDRIRPPPGSTNDGFGGAAKLVDANRDGRTELVVGAPGENAHAGSLWVFPTVASGVTAKGSCTSGHGTPDTVATAAGLGSSFNRCDRPSAPRHNHGRG